MLVILRSTVRMSQNAYSQIGTLFSGNVMVDLASAAGPFLLSQHAIMSDFLRSRFGSLLFSSVPVGCCGYKGPRGCIRQVDSSAMPRGIWGKRETTVH